MEKIPFPRITGTIKERSRELTRVEKYREKLFWKQFLMHRFYVTDCQWILSLNRLIGILLRNKRSISKAR